LRKRWATSRFSTRASGTAASSDHATIAVVVPDIANPVFAAFVKAAQGQGWHSRHTVVLADSDFDPDRERAAIAHLGRPGRTASRCARRALEADEVLELAGRVPLVLVNRVTDAADCIVLGRGARACGRPSTTLTALGHRRVAYVQGSALSWSKPAPGCRPRRAHREPRPGAGAGAARLADRDRRRRYAAAARVVASGATAVIAPHTDLGPAWPGDRASAIYRDVVASPTIRSFDARAGAADHA